MKPSERIQQVMDELVNEAKEKNAELAKTNQIGPYIELRDFYTTRAIVIVMDEMAEKTKLSGMGFGEF